MFWLFAFMASCFLVDDWYLRDVCFSGSAGFLIWVGFWVHFASSVCGFGFSDFRGCGIGLLPYALIIVGLLRYDF